MDSDDEPPLTYFLPDGIADDSPRQNSIRKTSFGRNAATINNQSKGTMLDGRPIISTDSVASISDTSSPFGSRGHSIWSSNSFLRSDFRGENRVLKDFKGSTPSPSKSLGFGSSRQTFSSSLNARENEYHPQSNSINSWPSERYEPRRVLQHPPGLSCPPGFDESYKMENTSSYNTIRGRNDMMQHPVSKSPSQRFNSSASSPLTGTRALNKPLLSDDHQFGLHLRSTSRPSTNFVRETPNTPLVANTYLEKVNELKSRSTWDSDGLATSRQFGIQDKSKTLRSPNPTRNRTKPLDDRTYMRTRTPESNMDTFHPQSPNRFDDECKPRLPLQSQETSAALPENSRINKNLFVAKGKRRDDVKEKEAVSASLNVKLREDPKSLNRNPPGKNSARGKDKEINTPRRQVYREKQMIESKTPVLPEKASLIPDSSTDPTSMERLAVASNSVECDTSSGTSSENGATSERVSGYDETVVGKEKEPIKHQVQQNDTLPLVETSEESSEQSQTLNSDQASDVAKSKLDVAVTKEHQTEKNKADKKKISRKKQKRGASSNSAANTVDRSTENLQDKLSKPFSMILAALVAQGLRKGLSVVSWAGLIAFSGARHGWIWFADKINFDGLLAVASSNAESIKTVLVSMAFVLFVHAAAWFVRIHRVAFRAILTHRHIGFCFAFLYGFPFLVHYVFPWAPPWAPVCLWYAFLVQLFCTNGPTAMVTSFRVIIPLVFLIEGISYHSFLLDLNGAELLLTSFIISALKTSNLRSPVFFLSLATQCLLAVFLGSELIVQWLQLALALYSLHYMAVDEDEWMSMGEEDDLYCNPVSIRRSIADYNHHLTSSRAASTPNSKRLNRRALAYIRGQKLR